MAQKRRSVRWTCAGTQRSEALWLREWRRLSARTGQTDRSELDSQVTFHSVLVLLASAIAFLLLGSRRSEAAILLLFCIALLLGGVLTPMIEVEANI